MPTEQFLRSVLRPAPNLAPEDSVRRFVQALRYLPANSLPILREGLICGMVSQEDVSPALAIVSPQEREAFLEQPLSALMRPIEVVIPTDAPRAEVERLFAERKIMQAPVADPDGYCHGMVFATDLLTPETPMPRLPLVGGMATPFGVYLTDGVLQAGVGNGALVAGGALLGFCFQSAYWATELFVWAGQKYAFLPEGVTANIDQITIASSPIVGLAQIGVRLFAIGVLLSLMRFNRIAGYHAAEHQTVHAMERMEHLTPEIVGRMPRPHPRCGTNIMAASVVFFTLFQMANLLPGMGEFALIAALLLTLATWRRVGTLFQEFFTTRPASRRELESGIRAGNDLIAQYLSQPPVRPHAWRRIWCMGILQNLMGVTLALALLERLEVLLRPLLGL